MPEILSTEIPARIRVNGYKSLRNAEVQIRPLTIFAGTNSSGKSSLMQLLLLIKQTAESSYRPESRSLVLRGDNVKLSDAAQVLPRHIRNKTENFWLEIESVYGSKAELCYEPDQDGQIRISLARAQNSKQEQPVEITPQSKVSSIEIVNPPEFLRNFKRTDANFILYYAGLQLELELFREVGQKGVKVAVDYGPPISTIATRLMHLPGLRGLPERSYPVTAENGPFRGTFEPYTASIIAGWQDSDPTKILDLSQSLRYLQLTRSVEARVKGATEVELLVGRLPVNGQGKDDLVNIADVGFGVSQVLPILVALIEAPSGAVVYIEQPELHLHPRAQQAMASVLADAAKRGVRVIIETHSNILLLAIQTLVAQGELAPDLVALHWFSRTQSGNTKVTFRELDETGSFGDWPEDFSDTELDAQSAYLDAVARRQAEAKA